jgi:lactoylglutathione lyase
MTVHELRVVLTVDDYEAALAFYRDALGLEEFAAYAAPNGGQVTLLNAGRATLELADGAQAEYIDQVEVGRRVAGRVRLAFRVDEVEEATAGATARGANLIAAPTRTPWNSRNARMTAVDGSQLTLFEQLAEE